MTVTREGRASRTEDTEWISEYFDSVACDHCEEYRKNGLSPSSVLLMNQLVEIGLTGKTLLDLGCGSGRFSVEVVRRGAGSSAGVDLSPKMIELARQLAVEKGVASKINFHVGDASKEEHPVSDIVVLDKVVCCYPEMEPLLSRAMVACQEVLGIIVPRDTGLARIPVRIGVYFDNLVSRVRRIPSKMYLHSLGHMDSILQQSGFRIRSRGKKGFWLILVYRHGKN